MTSNSKEEKMLSLQDMIEAANKEGLLMCMTDAEVNDIKNE